MAGGKLGAFVDALSKVAKVGDLPILEMDAAASEVTEEFLRVWLTSRIRHNKAMNRDLKEDTVYREVVKYVVELNSAFFFPRLWSETGLKTHVAEPLNDNQDVLDFVYRGGATLYARIFGNKSTDQTNPSFQALIKHVADSLCVMSTNAEQNLITDNHRAVFPVYNTTVELFNRNPWLVFIYYLCRTDIYELISVAKGANK